MNQGKIIIENIIQNSLLIKVLEFLQLPLGYEKRDAKEEDLVILFDKNEKSSDNILCIDTENFSFYKIISFIVESYVKLNHHLVNFEKPIIEGESKRGYSFHKGIALVELKPTMYSFTHNRYGIVEDTDIIRLRFWRLFATVLNESVSNHILNVKKDELLDDTAEKLISDNFPFISNYLGEISIEGKKLSIVKFEESIPQLEVIWKNYLVGTMKHNLKNVDQYKTRVGNLIEYESKFPKDIIRFDWRNNLPDKDECIPDEFADFYIDTKVARKIARVASLMLNRILQTKGYELVDLCYFMNYQGNLIHSEITPDGMRIRKKSNSFDKDLWRQGKDKEVIIKAWDKLYGDLTEETKNLTDEIEDLRDETA